MHTWYRIYILCYTKIIMSKGYSEEWEMSDNRIFYYRFKYPCIVLETFSSRWSIIE
jgi:hypothetical protein